MALQLVMLILPPPPFTWPLWLSFRVGPGSHVATVPACCLPAHRAMPWPYPAALPIPAQLSQQFSVVSLLRLLAGLSALELVLVLAHGTGTTPTI